MKPRTSRFSLTQAYGLWLALLLLGSLLALNGTLAQTLPIFRIGILDSQDGRITRGAKLAVEQINQNGGVVGADGTVFALELVIQPIDDLELAIANLTQAGVIAVLGPETDANVLANLTLLQSLQVPILTPAQDDTILALDTSDRIFRIRAQEVLQGRALAAYLATDIQPTRLATIQLDLESTAGVVGFTTALTTAGINAARTYLLENDNIPEFGEAIAADNPDVAVVYGAPNLTSQLYISLLAAGWEGIFIYNKASSSAFRASIPQETLAGIISATTWSFAATDQKGETFALDYLRAFSLVPSEIEAAAYDAVYVLATAIGKPGDLLTNLTTTRNISGVQGILGKDSLLRGELSDTVFITQVGVLGGQEELARFAGGQRLTEDIEVIEIPTATPQPTATPDGVTVTITRSVQNVRSGPGTNYDVIGQLRQGDQIKATGTNANNTWIVIDFRGLQGWLSADILDVFGDLNSLPILLPPPTPTPPPATATPTLSPIPDLVVISALPARLIMGTPFNATVTILNQGSGTAGPFAIAAAFEPGGVYSALNVPGLAGGQQTVVNLSATITGATGPQNVVIVTDLNQQVNEGATGETNNNFSYSYIADAPILTTNGTGTLVVANTAAVSLDNGTPDIQWSGGTLLPVGATRIIIMSGFSSLDQIHKDAVVAANPQTAPIATVPIGAIIGFQTDGGTNYGAFQVTEATSGGNLVFNFRVYQ
jgi:ABC-type branched-subunit amino acid transport system substrate-binding protein/uncharacterized protein YgiM (DUF1202 family)